MSETNESDQALYQLNKETASREAVVIWLVLLARSPLFVQTVLTDIPSHVIGNFRALLDSDISRYLSSSVAFQQTANARQQLIHYLTLLIIA